MAIQGKTDIDQLLAKIVTDAEGTVRTDYTYTEDGLPLTETFTGEAMSRTTTWTYNDDGDVLTEAITEADGSLVQKTIWSYENRRPVSETLVSEDATLYDIHFTYDDAGRVLTETYQGPEETTYTTTYTYGD